MKETANLGLCSLLKTKVRVFSMRHEYGWTNASS